MDQRLKNLPQNSATNISYDIHIVLNYIRFVLTVSFFLDFIFLRRNNIEIDLDKILQPCCNMIFQMSICSFKMYCNKRSIINHGWNVQCNRSRHADNRLNNTFKYHRKWNVCDVLLHTHRNQYLYERQNQHTVLV